MDTQPSPGTGRRFWWLFTVVALGLVSIAVLAAVAAELDSIFTEVLNGAGGHDSASGDRIVGLRERSRFALMSLTAALILLFAVAIAVVRGCQRSRCEAEEALRANRTRLLQSQKLATMGRIAGASLHDVDNYLAAIRGHCELVRMESPADGAITRRMDAVIRIVLKTSALIDRILAFGRKREPELEVVDLNRLVRGMCKMLSPALGTLVRVEERLAGDLWNVEADASQLEQLLANLLVNARDAMPSGGEVAVETANVGTEHVMLAVSDTGCGIPPEVRGKIFDPFFTTKGEAGNSGLGLATVYGIVHELGGSIEVESARGVGTCFSILLPRAQAPSSCSGHDAEARISRTPEPGQGDR